MDQQVSTSVRSLLNCARNLNAWKWNGIFWQRLRPGLQTTTIDWQGVPIDQGKPSPRAIANAELTQQIMGVYEMSDSSYGRIRIAKELADLGLVVNHKRVGRLMRMAQIKVSAKGEVTW